MILLKKIKYKYKWYYWNINIKIRLNINDIIEIFYIKINNY